MSGCQTYPGGSTLKQRKYMTLFILEHDLTN
jgi:hypothetical protein